MMNRRDLLKFGATVAECSSKPASGRNLSPGRARIAFHRAVFDEQCEECRRFGADSPRRSPPLRDSQQYSGLWYDDLRVYLSENSLRIPG